MSLATRKLLAIRKHNGWNQGRLAESLETHGHLIDAWECGRALPDMVMLDRINTLFDWSVMRHAVTGS